MNRVRANDNNNLKLKYFAEFKERDTDHNGSMDWHELMAAMAKEEKYLSATETTKLMNKIDTDEDRKIDFKEYLNWSTSK